MGRSLQTLVRATTKSAITMAFIKIAILLTALCGYALSELQSAETGSLASRADGVLAEAGNANVVLNKANLAEVVVSRMAREAEPEAAKKKRKNKKNKNKKKKLRKTKNNKKTKKGKKGKKGKKNKNRKNKKAKKAK